jgi:hypothetical protein
MIDGDRGQRPLRLASPSQGNCNCQLNHGGHGSHGNSEIQRHADDAVMNGFTVASVASVVKEQFNQLLLPFFMLFMSFMPFLVRLFP